MKSVATKESIKVCYRLGIAIDDNTSGIEDKLFDIFGYSDGSGSGFGTRDLAYYFSTLPKAMDAFKKVTRMRSWRSKIRLSLTMELE